MACIVSFLRHKHEVIWVWNESDFKLMFFTLQWTDWGVEDTNNAEKALLDVLGDIQTPQLNQQVNRNHCRWFFVVLERIVVLQVQFSQKTFVILAASSGCYVRTGRIPPRLVTMSVFPKRVS